MTRRSYLWTMVALVLAAAGLLVSAGQTWIIVEVDVAGQTTLSESVTGQSVVPLTTGAGIVLLAGVAGVVATRGVARPIIGGLLAVISGAALWAAASFAVGLPQTAVQAAQRSVADGVQAQSTSAWMLAAAGAGLGIGAAAMVALRGRSWPGLGSRYQRGDAAQAGRDLSPAQMWDALDRGEDPTTGP